MLLVLSCRAGGISVDMDDVHMLEKATNTHKHTRGDEIRMKL